jgi:hypothetical protein
MRTLTRFVFLFTLTATWFACKKVDIRYGDQFLDNGYTAIVKVDSFRTELTTVYVDSFVSSGKGVAVVGGYTDPVFGKIKAQTYWEVVPPAYVDGIADSFRAVTYDSIAVVFKPDQSYFGDTAQPVTLEVHRLSEPITPYDNTLQSIYNTRTFAVYPSPLGTRTLRIRPSSGDSLTIRLDDALGRELIRKFQNPADNDIKSNDGFLQYFYGLRMRAADGSKLIFGSKDSITLRVYYKKPGLYLQDRTLNFTLINKFYQFNNITVDRSGTPLQNLASAGKIPSTQSGNTAYTLYMAGAMTKIRFPDVRDILKTPNFAKILKASLIVRPLRGTYGTGSYVLPPEVRLSQTTQLNQIGTDISYINSNGSAQTQTGSLIKDELYGENTNYAYDITAYIKALLNDGTVNQNGLLLIPPSPALETQFGRLVVGNKDNSAGKMELLIVYAAIQ